MTRLATPLRTCSTLFVVLLTMRMPISGAPLIEVFGREKLADPGWPTGMLEVANLDTRYGGTIGPPFGGGRYQLNYRGDSAQLTETLRSFAKVDTAKPAIVLEDWWAPTVSSGDGKPAWSIVAWVPHHWNDLHNAPLPVGWPYDYGKPVPAPRLTVHLETGAIDWSVVQVPAGLTVIDLRKRIDGTLTETEFRGRIFDVDTGKGVADASIALSSRSTANAPVVAAAHSASDGRFVLSVLPDRYFVDIQREGCAKRRVAIEVERRETPAEHSIALAPVGSLRGRVVDADGAPVDGAQVKVFRARGPDGIAYVTPEELETRTAADGTFLLRPLPTGFVNLVAFTDAGEMPKGFIRQAHRVFPDTMSDIARDRAAELWPRLIEVQLTPK